ncbi:MAG: iron ABC transporter permease, partial [Proteobacteria bacterium]|nr:iron ABC transporter permease [Pseudomonadota bacterium]
MSLAIPAIGSRRWLGLDGWSLWSLAAASIAALVAVPIVVVLASLFVPSGEVWSHLSATVLPGYVVNSFVLMVGVGVVVLVTGVGNAWLVTMCRFPGR